MTQTTDTPSLSELVAECQDRIDSGIPTITDMHLLRRVVANLSRLSGNGVGAATPSASLEEEAQMREVLAGCAATTSQERAEAIREGRLADKIWIDEALAAMKSWARLSSSAAPQAQAAPAPNLEPQCGAGEADAFTTWWHEHVDSEKRSDNALDEVFSAPMYYLPRWCRAAFDAGVRATQAASAAAPTPIDDGAVERDAKELIAHGEFSYTSAAQNLENARVAFRAALQASQTKT